MVAFFFWFLAIWIFISLFSDIFRRNDLSGAAKAGWLLLLIILPFLGALIYIAMRPKVTAQDVEMMTRMEAGQKAAASVSVADQIAKLQELKAAGAIATPSSSRSSRRRWRRHRATLRNRMIDGRPRVGHRHRTQGGPPHGCCSPG